MLRRLAQSRRPEVRAAALTGLIRTGRDADVVSHLDDPAPLARALARDAARRTGVDALTWYRGVVLDAPTPPAVEGLAETSSESESMLLTPLLDHPEAKVRAAATRALRHLDAVEAERVVPMLHDSSPRVVREAVTALRPMAKLIEAQKLWQLLSAVAATACSLRGQQRCAFARGSSQPLTRTRSLLHGPGGRHPPRPRSHDVCLADRRGPRSGRLPPRTQRPHRSAPARQAGSRVRHRGQDHLLARRHPGSTVP